MNTVILFCAAMLAAENQSQVQAKVWYGTAAEEQHPADIDLWISKAVAKAGSPVALSCSDWIALTGYYQRLYTSKQGGFIIDGKVTEQDGKYEVEIDACAGFSLDRKVTLKPGERRVVNLTDDSAPNNVFIALEAPVSEQAKKRAEAMKAKAKTFVLELQYNGDEDKPFYRMIVSVPVVNRRRNSPFYRIVQVNEEQATRIIDHLAREGFLDHAVDFRTNIKVPAPSMPGYTMTVTVGDDEWYDDLGWGLPMTQRLDDLRDVFSDATKRKWTYCWEDCWGCGRSGRRSSLLSKHSRVRFLTEDNTTIISITSEF